MLARPRPGPSRLPGWPSLCAVCRGWGEARICARCIGRFAPISLRCPRCALPVPSRVALCGACIAAPPPFDAALARVDYGFPWDRLVAAFKFHAALDLASALAELVAAARPDGEAPAAGLRLVPVPLDARRLRERGFNQAWELARRVARRLRLDADPALVLRIRETPHQLALPPEERADNVRGAFAIEPRRRGEIRGARFAVVDDVMTTGSTLAEIARVLKDAGAAHVSAWVLARTPRPGEGG